MTRRWAFTDLELAVLWENATGELLPSPFTVISSTPSYYDYLREKRETRERLHATHGSSFDHVLTAIARPDLRITVNGWDTDDPDNEQERVRILAARAGGHGYVVTQLPGKTPDAGGSFTIAACDPVALADTVVAALPDAAPGAQAEIPLAAPASGTEDLDQFIAQSPTAADHGNVVSVRSKRFFRVRPTRMGVIDIAQGNSVFGPSGITDHRLEWRDLPDHGRYAIRHAAPWKAIGVDAQKLTTMINMCVADIIRVIKDERGS
ncbi:ESX secretion-associated protein EspG [Nocardia otitidiscaviarum]|uniref:ESX secretion-associated protein EspG n=1 Tax=Nocardia otitidiscaviarum TaxID=1823 RepID=UPI001895BC1F|nr:ESX secretion-associated protein EspG [Nocardia otitidiscaviarum]MBF6178435.1 ESX secretion-associated protein EspG [Nocardia otitidiscaviarum]